MRPRGLALAVLTITTTVTIVYLWPNPSHRTYTEPSPVGTRALCKKQPIDWIWPAEKKCVSCAAKSSKWATYLPKNVMDGVQYLLLFTGHGRSGGSIVGSLIDAHPNAVVANQYMLFTQFVQNPVYHDSKEKVFGKLVNHAQHQQAKKSSNRKGYTLSVGKDTQVDESTRLVVIGDKGASAFAGRYVTDPERFADVFSKLKEVVQVPVKVIQVSSNSCNNKVMVMLNYHHMLQLYYNGAVSASKVNRGLCNIFCLLELAFHLQW